MFKILKERIWPKSQDVLDRSQRALTVLNAPAFHEAVDDLELDMWEAFFKAPPNDKEAMVTLYNSANNLKLIKDRLEFFVTQGNNEQFMQKEGKKQ